MPTDITMLEPVLFPAVEADSQLGSYLNLIDRFCNRSVSSGGVYAVSHEGHRTHGDTSAERGYVRA